jgi:hypothetical protein
MKRAAVDPDRATGAAVLRRADEPIEKQPSQSPQMQPTSNDKAAGTVSGRAEAHNPPISAQPGAGKCFTRLRFLKNTLMSSL